MLSTEKTLAILALEGQNFFSAAPLTLQVNPSTRQLETKLFSQPHLLSVLGEIPSLRPQAAKWPFDPRPSAGYSDPA